MSFNLPRRSAFTAYPEIRRARGYHLYASSGRRFLNLYQDAGREILGIRPAGLGQRFKASLDKTGTGFGVSPWEGRLKKILLSYFSGYSSVTILSSADFSRFYPEAVQKEIWDPWNSGYGRAVPDCPEISLWRPWIDVPDADILIPVLPGAGTWGSVPVLSRTPLPLDPSPAAAFLLSAQVYAAGLLFQAIKEKPDDSWGDFPGPWERMGPYLFPSVGHSGTDRSLRFSA